MAYSYVFQGGGNYPSSSMAPTSSIYNSEQFTVQAWTNASSSVNGHFALLELGDASVDAEFILRINNFSGDTAQFYCQSNAGTKPIMSFNIGNLSEWVLWTFEYDATYSTTGRLRVYRNAIIDASSSAVDFSGEGLNQADGSGEWKLGAGTVLSHNTFDGAVAEVRMWKRILSGSEIALMVSQSELTTEQKSDMIGYWKMDEGSGSIFNCESDIGDDGMKFIVAGHSEDYWSPSSYPTESPAPPADVRDNYLENLLITKGLLPELAGEDSEVVNYYRRNAAITRKGKF